MFILEEPFISDYLKNTINSGNYPVFENVLTKNWGKNLKTKISPDDKIYTNSENALEILINQGAMPDGALVFKDKSKFRELLAKIYPDFFYKKIKFDELDNLQNMGIKPPFVIKPSVGFLSFGVHTIQNEDEIKSAIQKIKIEMESAKKLFPETVIKSNMFLIEEFIEGEEFAIDAYFSEDTAVILNIFQHPFLDINDVSDRLYITSSKIVQDNIESFSRLLNKIGEITGVKNFPVHIELRKNGEKIIPIEINPLRFCGWCLCDLAQYAHNINVYEYYFKNLKPDFTKSNDGIFAFVNAEVPQGQKIKTFDRENFEKAIGAEILERRTYDFNKKPLLASYFIKANQYEDIKHILSLKTESFVNAL